MPTYIDDTCDKCNRIFYRTLREHNMKIKSGAKNTFCSKKCQGQFATLNGTFKTTCGNCGKPIIKGKSRKTKSGYNFCSKSCSGEHRRRHKTTRQEVVCLNCDKRFYKRSSEIAKSPNNFCSRSCAATYSNKNKTYGIRRSKLEAYIEDKLKSEFPDLNFIANGKQTIGSELDLYFPDLKLAIEINGPLHYQPIYGEAKLLQIQNNDKLKKIACKDNNIKFIVMENLERFSNKFANLIWLQIVAILPQKIMG